MLKTAKDFFISLTLAAAAADLEMQKKFFGPGTTTLKISSKEIGDAMKIVKSPDNPAYW